MKSRNTIIGNVRIKDDYVYKKCDDQQLIDLFEYLKSLNFYHFPDYSFENNYIRYQYIKDLSVNDNMKIKELIKTTALLHQKTSFYKEINSEIINELYQKYLNHVDYYLKYFYDYFNDHLKTEYLSPANYIIMRNYTLIKNYLLKTKTVINDWYNLVKDQNSVRVSIIHNNLELNHFIINNPNYLISFDHAMIESSLLDLVKLFQKYFYLYDFKSLLTEYIGINPLDESEKALLRLLILVNFNYSDETDIFKQVKNDTFLIIYLNKALDVIAIL